MSRPVVFSECFIVSLCFFSLISFSVHAEDISRPHGITASGLGTTVTVQDRIFNITGGTQKGSNLFHSFGKFNVHSGETAKFNDSGIRNTVGRITGGEYSWINGILKSGAENLYLLNPGGFVFGSGATLDLKGSFHVSTADYLRMGDNERFYAVPQQNEVLSVAEPGAFGFVDNEVSKISIEGSFLKVPQGKNISVIGGDISMHDSVLFAESGQIRLASGASAGEVEIRQGGMEMKGFEKQGEISITRDSDFIKPNDTSFYADLEASGMTEGNKGGQVVIRGGNLQIVGSDVGANNRSPEKGSGVDIIVTGDMIIDGAGITNGGGIQSNTYASGDAGDIDIRADHFTMTDTAFISSGTSGEGNSGTITVEAEEISVRNGSTVYGNTSGKGTGSNISLKAEGNVSFSGENVKGTPSSIEVATFSENEGAGDGGNLSIEAESIVFGNGAAIYCITTGNRNAGSVTLDASDTVSFSGESSKGQTSSVSSGSYTEKGIGAAGEIRISASEISFRDGARINSTTFGRGTGGDIELKASDTVTFSGEDSQGYNTAITAGTTGTAEDAGNSGNISIEAGEVSFENGAIISNASLGTGNAGNVTIKASESVSFSGQDSAGIGCAIILSSKLEKEGSGNAGSLLIEAKNISLTGGARIQSHTYGTGNGGDITLKASDTLLFKGEDSEGTGSYIGMGTSYIGNGAGRGGNLDIEADHIFFEDGAFINVMTKGDGSGGNVNLYGSDTIRFAGEGSSGLCSSIALGTGLYKKGTGSSGNVLMTAKHIAFEKGAWISTGTFYAGDGGNISVRASESISFSGYNSKGNAAYISSETSSEEESAGDSGSIFIEAKDVRFQEGAYLSAGSSGYGNGGEIALNVADMTFQSGANIQSGALGKGDAGTVRINASETVSFSGEDSKNTSAIGVFTFNSGNGGNVFINAKNISFTDGAGIESDSASTGNAGNVILSASESVIFSGESRKGFSSDISTSSTSMDEESSNAGSIEIRARDILFENHASISSNLSGDGMGGSITLDAENIFFRNDSDIYNVTEGRGNGGNIRLTASDTVRFSSPDKSSDRCSITMFTTSLNDDAGKGGSLIIEGKNIIFEDGASIAADTSGKGKAGNVTLKAGKSVEFRGEDSEGYTTGISVNCYQYEGNAGNILIEAENISFTDGADLGSSTLGKGDGGNVTLMASESVTFSGEDSDGSGSGANIYTFSKEDGAGDGGSLLINAKNIFITDGATLNGTTSGKGNGGTIVLRAAEQIRFGGETKSGYESMINSVVHRLSNGGHGGDVRIEAGELLLTDGGKINTGTSGPGDAGNIHIAVRGSAFISGQDSEGDSSGVFSESLAGGNAGDIYFSAGELSLINKGQITASGKNAGNAGKITLDVGRLYMSRGASVSSESRQVNSTQHADNGERNDQILILGDIVEVKDVQDGVHDGKTGRFINTGSGMVLFPNVYRVSDVESLNTLDKRYALWDGDVAVVDDMGNGQSGKYIYTFFSKDSNGWVKFENTPGADLSGMADLNKISNHIYISEPYYNKEMAEYDKFIESGADPAFVEQMKNEFKNRFQKAPYPSGTLIQVNDAGDGKPAYFVYASENKGETAVFCRTIMLKHFDVNDPAELNQLPLRFSLSEGTVATVADQSRYIYSGGQWIKFNNVHTAENRQEMQKMTMAQTGHVAEVSDAGEGKPEQFIYTGKDWIVLKDTHVATNIAERDALSAKNGDAVYVSDSDGKGNSANFLFADGKWTPFISGNAGNIVIHADSVSLDGGTIMSSSEGHGKAGNISLSVKNLSLDNNASVSTRSNSPVFGGDAGAVIIAGNVETDDIGRPIGITQASGTVRLLNSSTVTTETNDAGGGKITVNAENLLYLNSSGIITSVHGGDGKGGNIDISTPEFTVMNNSLIRADAYEGDGGNIHIASDHFLKSFESIVSASSALGIDGIISIESPEEDVTAGLITISTDFIDAGKWLPVPCSQRSGEKRSRFTIDCRDSVPTAPDGCLGGPVFELRTEE